MWGHPFGSRQMTSCDDFFFFFFLCVKDDSVIRCFFFGSDITGIKTHANHGHFNIEKVWSEEQLQVITYDSYTE